MVSSTKKFITAEYHDGQMAYEQGRALTTNPHLSPTPVHAGKLWYWVWGWQDAMADDVRRVKEAILTITQPIDKKGMN